MPTPVGPNVRLPEYFTADNSRSPTSNFAVDPLRVDGMTKYEPESDHRFTLLTERFIYNNHAISDKREGLEPKRLQTFNLEHEKTPAPFIVT